MEPITQLRVSASAIRAYQGCAHRYALDYVERLPDAEREPVAAFAFGDAIHKALAQFIRMGGHANRSLDDLIELLMRYWDARVYQDEEASHMQFQRGRELLEAFYFNPYPTIVTREVAVEAYVRWSAFRRGVLAVGRLDRVCLLTDGTLEVLDYKSGRPPQDRDAIKTDLQAVFYRTLAAEAYRELRPTGIRVTFLYLDGMVPISTVLDKETFQARWAEVEAVVTSIRRDRRYFQRGLDLAQAFPPHRSEQCRTCPMRRHCDRQFPQPARLVALDGGAL